MIVVLCVVHLYLFILFPLICTNINDGLVYMIEFDTNWRNCCLESKVTRFLIIGVCIGFNLFCCIINVGVNSISPQKILLFKSPFCITLQTPLFVVCIYLSTQCLQKWWKRLKTLNNLDNSSVHCSSGVIDLWSDWCSPINIQFNIIFLWLWNGFTYSYVGKVNCHLF